MSKYFFPKVLFASLILSLNFAGSLFAGENNGTIGAYGATDGNICGRTVCLSNSETYTNNGDILAWRGAVNLRSRSGTTFVNSAGALIDFSGTGGWMPGGTNAETSTGTLNNTLENYGTIGRLTANNRPVHTESTGNNTVNNYATGSILSSNTAVSFWSNRGTNSFTNSGTVTGGNYGFEASFKDRSQAGSLATLSLTFVNNSGATITGTNQNGAHIAAPDVPVLTNAGTIVGGVDGVWLHSGTTVTAFTNTGTITGATIDIDNDGTITTMSNNQGGNDTLTFDGKVPTNYKVIINSTTDFGKIDFSNETGSLTFAIDSSSTISANTYASVLQNIAAGNIGNEASWTNYNATYKWRLVANGTDWDLEIANRRTAYTARITGKLNKILEVLESINTNSLNSSLTTALDSLSDAALEKVASQINGVTVKKILGNGAKKHSTFKRALSKVTSLNTGSVASSTAKTSLVSSLTKNNHGALSLNDLENNGLYTSNQNSFGPANAFTDFDFKSLVNIYKNKNLFSVNSENSSFFVRTFAEVTDQNKVGSEVGYNSNSGGILLGKKNKINEKKEQGWALGFSINSSDFDENYGNNDSQTIHASIYQVEDFEKYSASINLGTFITRGVLDRKITEGLSQTLNSKNFDVGFDATATLSKKINLINNWQINPSISFNTTYIIQDDINESGGDLALDIKTNNLLIAKPELGFDLNKVFADTETRSKQFNFSLYGSLESKLDGTTSNAKIKDTGSSFNIVDDNKDDKFVSLGIGYTDFNKENNKEHSFSLFRTENEHGNLNSTLLSYTFKQNF